MAIKINNPSLQTKVEESVEFDLNSSNLHFLDRGNHQYPKRPIFPKNKEMTSRPLFQDYEAMFNTKERG